MLPLLATFNPQIAQQLRETGALAAAEDELLSELEDVAWREIARPSPPEQVRLGRDGWRNQPLALRRRLLRRAAAACLPAGAEVGFQTIEAARRTAEGLSLIHILHQVKVLSHRHLPLRVGPEYSIH